MDETVGLAPTVPRRIHGKLRCHALWFIPLFESPYSAHCVLSHYLSRQEAQVELHARESGPLRVTVVTHGHFCLSFVPEGHY